MHRNELSVQNLDIIRQVVIDNDPKQDFKLIQSVGKGTYGEVFKAIRLKTGELSAVKIIKIVPKDDIIAILQEIRTLRECRHSNIVQFFGSYFRNNKLWICMEYCGGFSIQDIYTITRVPLKEDCIAFLTRETLRGVEYMHRQGRIHRDIKGANILLSYSGDVKIADFGIAARITETVQRRNSFVGTPYWMAPEVAAVERKGGYDERCDIWAIGITSIEYAEMQPPMFDLHPMKALRLLANRNYKSPTLQRKELWSSKFHSFLKCALTKNEKRRPSASVMLKHEFVTQEHLSRKYTYNLLEEKRLSTQFNALSKVGYNQPIKKSNSNNSKPANNVAHDFANHNRDIANEFKEHYQKFQQQGKTENGVAKDNNAQSQKKSQVTEKARPEPPSHLLMAKEHVLANGTVEDKKRIEEELTKLKQNPIRTVADRLSSNAKSAWMAADPGLSVSALNAGILEKTNGKTSQLEKIRIFDQLPKQEEGMVSCDLPRLPHPTALLQCDQSFDDAKISDSQSSHQQSEESGTIHGDEEEEEKSLLSCDDYSSVSTSPRASTVNDYDFEETHHRNQENEMSDNETENEDAASCKTQSPVTTESGSENFSTDEEEETSTSSEEEESSSSEEDTSEEESSFESDSSEEEEDDSENVELPGIPPEALLHEEKTKKILPSENGVDNGSTHQNEPTTGEEDSKMNNIISPTTNECVQSNDRELESNESAECGLHRMNSHNSINSRITLDEFIDNNGDLNKRCKSDDALADIEDECQSEDRISEFGFRIHGNSDDDEEDDDDEDDEDDSSDAIGNGPLTRRRKKSSNYDLEGLEITIPDEPMSLENISLMLMDKSQDASKLVFKNKHPNSSQTPTTTPTPSHNKPNTTTTTNNHRNNGDVDNVRRLLNAEAKLLQINTNTSPMPNSFSPFYNSPTSPTKLGEKSGTELMNELRRMKFAQKAAWLSGVQVSMETVKSDFSKGSSYSGQDSVDNKSLNSPNSYNAPMTNLSETAGSQLSSIASLTDVHPEIRNNSSKLHRRHPNSEMLINASSLNDSGSDNYLRRIESSIDFPKTGSQSSMSDRDTKSLRSNNSINNHQLPMMKIIAQSSIKTHTTSSCTSSSSILPVSNTPNGCNGHVPIAEQINQRFLSTNNSGSSSTGKKCDTDCILNPCEDCGDESGTKEDMNGYIDERDCNEENKVNGQSHNGVLKKGVLEEAADALSNEIYNDEKVKAMKEDENTALNGCESSESKEMSDTCQPIVINTNLDIKLRQSRSKLDGKIKDLSSPPTTQSAYLRPFSSRNFDEIFSLFNKIKAKYPDKKQSSKNKHRLSKNKEFNSTGVLASHKSGSMDLIESKVYDKLENPPLILASSKRISRLVKDSTDNNNKDDYDQKAEELYDDRLAFIHRRAYSLAELLINNEEDEAKFSTGEQKVISSNAIPSDIKLLTRKIQNNKKTVYNSVGENLMTSSQTYDSLSSARLDKLTGWPVAPTIQRDKPLQREEKRAASPDENRPVSSVAKNAQQALPATLMWRIQAERQSKELKSTNSLIIPASSSQSVFANENTTISNGSINRSGSYRVTCSSTLATLRQSNSIRNKQNNSNRLSQAFHSFEEEPISEDIAPSNDRIIQEPKSTLKRDLYPAESIISLHHSGNDFEQTDYFEQTSTIIRQNGRNSNMNGKASNSHDEDDADDPVSLNDSQNSAKTYRSKRQTDYHNAPGAHFSSIYELCPYKINATASWINPITNQNVVLLATNDGIYYIDMTNHSTHTNSDIKSQESLKLLFSHRCQWLTVVQDTMISLSGPNNQLFNHNLVTLMTNAKSQNATSQSGQSGPKFAQKLTNLLPKRFQASNKIPATKYCLRVSMARNPFNGAKYLCAAMVDHILVMEWFNPLSNFIEIKRVPVKDMPNPLLSFDLIILKDRPLPLACLGVYRHYSRKGRQGLRFRFFFVDLNSDLSHEDEYASLSRSGSSTYQQTMIQKRLKKGLRVGGNSFKVKRETGMNGKKRSNDNFSSISSPYQTQAIAMNPTDFVIGTERVAANTYQKKTDPYQVQLDGLLTDTCDELTSLCNYKMNSKDENGDEDTMSIATEFELDPMSFSSTAENSHTNSPKYRNSHYLSEDALAVVEVVQLEANAILVCFEDCAKVLNLAGRLKSSKYRASTIHFNGLSVESIVCLRDSILVFHPHGLLGKSFLDETTLEINDNDHIYRLLGHGDSIVVEHRPTLDPLNNSNVFLLTANHTNVDDVKQSKLSDKKIDRRIISQRN